MSSNLSKSNSQAKNNMIRKKQNTPSSSSSIVRSWKALAVGLLVTMASTDFSKSDAFTPSSLVSSSKTAFLSSTQPSSAFSIFSSTQTQLQMGMIEDMVTGANKSSLKKTNDAYISTLQKRVDAINALEPEIEDLGDEELEQKTQEFRKRLKDGGEDVNGKILEEAFAVVREAAWRVLEQRHYDVQLLGGMILHEGRIAEMATGEGKTLVSTLPCYLNALTGTSTYVITVNDYLAKRDFEKMGQVHKFLGLSVGLIQAGMNEEERRKAYACDVTYVTNSELGFDYLRDHLALTKEGTVLPEDSKGEFNGFCVVDEADSVLIDEARTPLIISKQEPAPATKYSTAQKIANALIEDVHYKVDLKNKNVVLNEKGYRDCENALGIESLFAPAPDGSSAWAPYISNAVKAKELFTKDIEYSVITDDKTGEKTGVGIIDSFTGRVLDGRRWADGLHQSIEAKEMIEVSSQSKVIAKVTYQALFRQFSRLSGMTGTAIADAEELANVYGLLVTPVPTALPVARRDYPDVAFKTRKAANDALVKEVINVGGGEEDGRPCLIGTTSVAQSEMIVKALNEKGVKAELLNASPKNAARESEIIAQAGRAGVVTVATNMAGRGTDILLGGCPSTMSRLKVRSQIVDTSGLLADGEKDNLPPSPPEEYFPTDLDEDCSFLLKDAIASLRKEFDSTPITALKLEEILTIATDTTEGGDDPDYIVKLRDVCEAIKELYKDVLSEEKEIVKSLGGLYVMGTNRHESSRIDQQLRGRSGRQGDPGTSRFFLSFEDDMFVVFGGDGLQNILKTFRVSDDMPVEAPQITDALDKVQVAVEEKYREIREQILNFDEQLNSQRRVIYSKRQETLFGDAAYDIQLMQEYNKMTVEAIVEAQTDKDDKAKTVNVDKVLEKIAQFFPIVSPLLQKSDLEGMDSKGVSTFINLAVDEVFMAKKDELESKAKDSGKPGDVLARTANYIALVSLDNAWSDHLQNMENLKETVILRKYQGRDPVAEYKNDAFNMFEGLEEKIRFNTVYSLWQSISTTPSAPAS